MVSKKTHQNFSPTYIMYYSSSSQDWNLLVQTAKDNKPIEHVGEINMKFILPAPFFGIGRKSSALA